MIPSGKVAGHQLPFSFRGSLQYILLNPRRRLNMALYSLRRVIWVLVLLFSLVGLSGLLLNLSPTAAQSICGPRAPCPSPIPQSGGGSSNNPSDGRLNTSVADPFVIYCVTGQFQIYWVDSFSHGQLLSTHPLNQVIPLNQTNASMSLGRGFTLERAGDNLTLFGPGNFHLGFGVNDCLLRAGLPQQPDFNCDGSADTVQVGAPGENPFVKVIDGKSNTLLLNFFAYDPA